MSNKKLLAMVLVVTGSVSAMESRLPDDDTYSARQSKSQTSTSVPVSQNGLMMGYQEWRKNNPTHYQKRKNKQACKSKQADLPLDVQKDKDEYRLLDRSFRSFRSDIAFIRNLETSSKKLSKQETVQEILRVKKAFKAIHEEAQAKIKAEKAKECISAEEYAKEKAKIREEERQVKAQKGLEKEARQSKLRKLNVDMKELRDKNDRRRYINLAQEIVKIDPNSPYETISSILLSQNAYRLKRYWKHCRLAALSQGIHECYDECHEREKPGASEFKKLGKKVCNYYMKSDYDTDSSRDERDFGDEFDKLQKDKLGYCPRPAEEIYSASDMREFGRSGTDHRMNPMIGRQFTRGGDTYEIDGPCKIF